MIKAASAYGDDLLEKALGFEDDNATARELAGRLLHSGVSVRQRRATTRTQSKFNFERVAEPYDDGKYARELRGRRQPGIGDGSAGCRGLALRAGGRGLRAGGA